MSQNFPFNHFLKFENQTQEPVIAKAYSGQSATAPIKTSNEIAFSSDELKTLTEALLENLKSLVNPQKYEAFLANSLTISGVFSDSVELMVSNSFIKRMIETHYSEFIKQGISEILGKNYGFVINVLGQTQDVQKKALNNGFNQSASKKNDSIKNTSFFIENLEPTHDDLHNAIDSRVIEHQSSPHTTHIDLNKTFNNFVIGSSNNIAYALSLAVAKDPGKTYPALYIYGNSGLGKTHLIHAIANHIQMNNPDLRICITSANKFTTEMVDAMVVKNKSYEFKRKYTEQVDVLIIDDIHELKNKTTTQEMFFHIFNELIQSGKQLVFTSDKTPKEIVGIEDRIRTRLSSALPVEIQQPDFETRIAILKKKALEKDIYLSDDVVHLIAKCVKNNIRELEGCLIKLGAVTSILKVDIDLEVAKEHLDLNEELENQKNITIESITKTVANYYKIPLGDIRGKSKTKEVALPRQVAMYLISKMIKPGLKENGQYFSGRDHSTVIYAIKTISDRIKTDGHLAQQLLDIEKQL
jgi:chromosomal replication initiator protein